MEQLSPMLTNGMQIATIYVCPALAIAVTWIGGGRGVSRLSKAGGIGGAIGGTALAIFEQLVLPIPWWESASRFFGMVVVGALMGAAVGVVASRFRGERVR